MKKRVALLLILLLVLLPAGFYGLISSEDGSQWLLRKVFSILPARVSVATMEGRLLDRIALSDFHYQTDTESIAVKSLGLTWRPLELFSGSLKIVDVAVNGVKVDIKEAKEPEQESGIDLNAELTLPVRIDIDNFMLTDMQFRKGDFVQDIEKLQLSVGTVEGQLKINDLTVNAGPIVANAQGKVTLGKGFPFKVNMDWQVKTGQSGYWHGSSTIAGNIDKMTVENHLSEPFRLDLTGNLDDLQATPRISARADWSKLVWPITGSPQVKSDQGNIELSGLLDDYRITLNGQLSQQYLPESKLTVKGRGSQNDLTIEKLELESKAGLFQLDGKISWLDNPALDVTATGQNFNPVILNSELPGSLSFKAHIKGKRVGEALQLDASIDKLSGQLRGYPVSANGKLLLNDGQLKVDALQLHSGSNKIAVNGTMGQEQGALDIAIDTPALDKLWPTLGGSLKGEGQLQGTWKNPTIKFQAKGKQLRFDEHSADQLNIDIDYSPDTKKTSKIVLSASSIKSGMIQLDSVQADGLGTLARHDVKVAIKSPYGDLTTALAGHLKDGNWKGDMSRLDLNSRDSGRWRLNRNLIINLAQRPSGVDVTLDEACLVQNPASLCAHGRYLANGDLDFSLKAKALPTKLMKIYFPEQMQLNGIVNADADIHRQKGLLTGRYQLNLAPAAKLSLQGKAVTLGASALSGKIKGDTVSADVDLALSGQDHLRGMLQMNTGNSQALSGQISASIRELAIVEAFVPQLSGAQGLLTADLAVKGTLQKPVVTGQIDLAKGRVDMIKQGTGLRDINLHAVASGGVVNRIQVNGSVLPVLLKQVNSAEQLQLNGLVNINADFQQQEESLSGHYRIDTPPLTILVGTKEALTKIKLGASSMSGNIKGEQISADIDFRLAGQDYLRAQLQMDVGESQALSGRMNASVVEFALLNPLAPRLSNIKGHLTSDLTLQGTLEKPAASGTLRFKGGAVDINELGLSIRDIKFQALASGGVTGRIQMTGSARSGQGAIYLDGFAVLQEQAGWPVELMLKGENFEVARIPEAQIAVSPDLKFAFRERNGKVTGRLKVPKAIMTMKELPENAVKVSPDEIIIGEEKVEEKATVTPGIDANIVVELGKDVSFSGQGLTTNLTGKLNITRAGEKMAMFGNVDMVKARYKSYGQDLTVRKGRFQFNGPVDNPWLDVEAIRVSNSKEVTAILSLTGSLEKPQTRISSDPSLPESEALAYLITGRPLSQVSKSEGNMLASAALSYGGGKATWLTEKLGIDEFEVQEGEKLQDTLVAVGEYLTPDFYVGAKVGLFNKQAAMVLKHKITDSINVETQAGTSQRVKLNYEIEKE